jgi:hypothetical protein
MLRSPKVPESCINTLLLKDMTMYLFSTGNSSL